MSGCWIKKIIFYVKWSLDCNLSNKTRKIAACIQNGYVLHAHRGNRILLPANWIGLDPKSHCGSRKMRLIIYLVGFFDSEFKYKIGLNLGWSIFEIPKSNSTYTCMNACARAYMCEREITTKLCIYIYISKPCILVAL